MNPCSPDPSQDQDGKEDAFRKATADVFEAPDFGEPWKAMYSSRIEDRYEYWKADTRSNALRDRIVSCVNACAGMADPAEEIASLKGERDCLNSELSAICGRANAHDAAEACEVIQGMREAIRDAHLELQYATGTNHSVVLHHVHKALAKLQPFLP